MQTNSGLSFGAAGGSSWLLPVVGVVITLIVIGIIVFVVIKKKSTSTVQTLTGPVDLFAPKNVVLINRTGTTKNMGGSYTLSFYMRVDAVPDMRSQGIPLLTWPGVWNLNYIPAHEQLAWVFEQTPDAPNTAVTPDTVILPHVPLQRWNQVVIGFEGRTVDLYINGKLIKSDILSNVPPSANASISIVGGNLIGQLAYVQLWPRRITTTEVAANYVETSDSQGRPYLGPEFITALTQIKIPNLFCPGGDCGGKPVAAKPSQTWEFPYA